MPKFSLTISILIGFSISTLGWLSFEAGRQVQLAGVAQPTPSAELPAVENLPTPIEPCEAESQDFEQRDQNACKSKFTNDSYTYTPIKGNPESTFDGLNGGLEINKEPKRLLRLKPTEELVGRWLTFPISNGTAKTTKDGSRFRRYPTDLRGDDAKRIDTPFADVTGDGVNDVIVASYSGGAHCCYEYDVYSLKDRRAKKFEHLDGNHSTFEFVDLNEDGKFEAIGSDWTFAYWKAGFAQSPAPLVILSPGKRGYNLNLSLMKLPPPSDKELKALVDACVAEVDKDNAEPLKVSVRSEVWATMLDLIYSGNSNFAWRLLDLYWPDGIPSLHYDSGERDLSKKQFKNEFLEQLTCSPYWKELKALNPDDRFLRSHK